MAGQKISLLPPVASVLPTDMFVISRGGNTYKTYGSTLTTSTQFNQLATTVGLNATKVELERVRSSVTSASAATTLRIDNIASLYTTAEYVNTQIDQAKVYINEKAFTFNNELSGYVAKPNNPQIGNNLIWNGSKWIADNPAPTAINNYSLDTASVGVVVWFAASVPPVGYLECNGASVSRTEYADLFTAIGTTFGSTDSDHFTLPDLRSEFIRGWDNGRGIDIARSFASNQTESLSSHIHGVSTLIDTTVFTSASTNVNTSINGGAVTTVSTIVTADVATDVYTTVNTRISSYSSGDYNLSATLYVPVDIPTVVYDDSGTYTLASGTNIIFSPLSSFQSFPLNTSFLGTLATSAVSTAVSLATSTITLSASSPATTTLELTGTSTAVTNASSTAFSLASSTMTVVGGTETRPRNVALLPCIKHGKNVEVTSLTSALSSYVLKPLNAKVGQYIGYNGTTWTAMSGLPLTAGLNQFLQWNGTAWVAGEYPSNLQTHQSVTLTPETQTSFINFLDIPSTAKRISIVCSQVMLNGGTTIKIKLGTQYGVVASNYKSNITAIGPASQRMLNSTDSFSVFGAITYTSIVPNALVPTNATITSQGVNATITFTKTGANTWVFANTGSIEEWSVFGGGSITLPATLDRISFSASTTTLKEGIITLHWE